MDRLTPKELKNVWDLGIVESYKKTILDNNPETTAKEIASVTGADTALCALAAYAKLWPKEGRITPDDRKRLDVFPVDDDAVVWDRNNPFISADLDAIHPSHLHNIINALLEIREERKK